MSDTLSVSGDRILSFVGHRSSSSTQVERESSKSVLDIEL